MVQEGLKDFYMVRLCSRLVSGELGMQEMKMRVILRPSIIRR